MTVGKLGPNDLERLALIHDVCLSSERRFGESDEHAPEVVRLIRALSTGRRAVFSRTSPVATMLREEFADRSELWSLVLIVEPDPTE